MKAISISVFRSNLGDCTNGGISSKYDDLLLVCEDGYINIDENNLPENLVVMEQKASWGGTMYKYIRPYANSEEGHTDWMSGGNLAYTSDARFRSRYPLQIFDRQETWKDYEALSR